MKLHTHKHVPFRNLLVPKRVRWDWNLNGWVEWPRALFRCGLVWRRDDRGWYANMLPPLFLTFQPPFDVT